MKKHIMASFILLLLAGSLFTLIGSVNATDDNWPMYRHDAQRTGYSTSTVPSTNETRWIYNATSEFDSSPAVANGRLIVGQSNGDILAINVTTGKLIWQYMTLAGENTMWSSPAIDSGRVYIGCRNNNLYCLNESTGQILWIDGADNCIDSSPLVQNGRLYFGSDDGKLRCVNSTTGSAIWTHATGGGFASPSIADDVVYITGNGAKVYALNAETGSVIWEVSAASSESSPLVQNGRVYFGGTGIYCLDATNGASIWNSSNSPSGIFSVGRSSPAVLNNRLYIGSNDGKLYCIDATSGSVLWNYQTAGEIWGSPAVADGKVLIGCGLSNSKIYCMDAITGESIWSYQTGYRSLSGPAVCDGIVYAGAGGGGFLSEATGSLYAFGPNSMLPTNVTLNLNADTAYLGFKITLNGTLTFRGNGTAIANAPIELSYSINNGQTWTDITSVTTTNDGSYNAIWNPSATGNFLVKAKLAENYPYAQSEAYKTLSITPYNNQYVFSIESNSTVTSLAYSSSNNQLSFTVSGDSGTIGFVHATIAKNFVGNIADLVVSLDGNNLQYQVTQTADSWIISFVYSHSTHSVNVLLGSLPSSPTPTPTQTATPSTNPTANPTAKPTTSPSNTPTVPEVPIWIVLILPIITVVMFAIARSPLLRGRR